MARSGWLAVLALAVLTLAACGGGSSDASETATAVTDPTATNASETATSGPSLTSVADTPAPTQTPTPLIPGGRIRELTWGDPVSIDGFAAIIGVGCFGCDGPLAKLVRLYRDPAGELRQDVLFEQEPFEYGARYIGGIAISEDGARVAVTVCTLGYCGGVAYASEDAASSLHISPDGRMTYSVGELPGASAAAGYGAEGLLLWNQDSDGMFSYEWHDSGQPLSGPSRAPRFPVLAAGARAEFWITDDRSAVLLTDGTVVWETPVEGGEIGQVFPRPDGGVLLIFWNLGGASFVTRSMGGQDINHVRIRGGLLVPWSWHDADTITANFWAGESTPVLFRPGSGSIRPLEGPFATSTSDADPGRLFGRNSLLATIPGAFARVVTGEGECLNVRSAPALIAEVRGCWADSVLFGTEGRTEFLDGREWVEVTPPGAKTGWAAAEFLEYARASEEPPVGYAVTTYDGDQKSGIAAVDRVLETVIRQQPVRLANLFLHSELACEHEPSGGFPFPPECEAGEEEGTPIEVFLQLSCHGAWSRAENDAEAALGLILHEPRLAAVYRVPPERGLTADYGIVLADRAGDGRTIYVTDEGISAIAWGCSPGIGSQLEEASDYILPPLD